MSKSTQRFIESQDKALMTGRLSLALKRLKYATFKSTEIPKVINVSTKTEG